MNSFSQQDWVKRFQPTGRIAQASPTHLMTSISGQKQSLTNPLSIQFLSIFSSSFLLRYTRYPDFFAISSAFPKTSSIQSFIELPPLLCLATTCKTPSTFKNFFACSIIPKQTFFPAWNGG